MLERVNLHFGKVESLFGASSITSLVQISMTTRFPFVIISLFTHLHSVYLLYRNEQKSTSCMYLFVFNVLLVIWFQIAKQAKRNVCIALHWSREMS